MLLHGLAFNGDWHYIFLKFHQDEQSIEFVVVVVRVISFLLWHHKRVYTFWSSPENIWWQPYCLYNWCFLPSSINWRGCSSDGNTAWDMQSNFSSSKSKRRRPCSGGVSVGAPSRCASTRTPWSRHSYGIIMGYGGSSTVLQHEPCPPIVNTSIPAL